jgi:PqqA peptide cyclase
VGCGLFAAVQALSEADSILSSNSQSCQRASIGLLADLTHRCPLQCPYCSNPLALEGADAELHTAVADVLRQAALLGVLQLHLSEGEPTVCPDLE